MNSEYLPDIYINFLNAVNKGIEITRPERFLKRLQSKSMPDDPSSKKLIDVTLGAHDELLRVNTIFPFTLFPDTVVIDREKLTIANRFFFRVAKINSVPIEDILSVEADVGPFFGSVYINSKYFVANPRSVKFLRRNDAIKIQRLVQGYIIAHEKKIDCLSIDKQQLEILLYDLGQGIAY